mgnify:CR=1 FL=1
MQHATSGLFHATINATGVQHMSLKALALKVLDRNEQRNNAATPLKNNATSQGENHLQMLHKLEPKKAVIQKLLTDCIRELKHEKDITICFCFSGIGERVIAEMITDELSPLDWDCIKTGVTGKETLKDFAKSILFSPWRTSIPKKINQLREKQL